MDLYVCKQEDKMAKFHPCGQAAVALREAGYDFDMKPVGGYRALPWTRRNGERDTVEKLSGQKDVPILVLDGGDVVTGTAEIVTWAKENPATA